MCQVLVAAGGLLSCSMQTLSCSMHVGPSSLTRDRTQAPCIGSMEPYPLCHQGSPKPNFKYQDEGLLSCAHSISLTIFLLPHLLSLFASSSSTQPCKYRYSLRHSLRRLWSSHPSTCTKGFFTSQNPIIGKSCQLYLRNIPRI